MSEPDLVGLNDITAARARLAPVLRPTPATFSHSLSKRFGRDVWLKPEHRQRTGSFKIRGAYNLQAQLDPGTAVVAGSAGNHAQGVALAAALLDQPATIVMPRGASLPKVQATRAYGAEVVLDGATTDDAIAVAKERAESTGAVYVPPFDAPEVIAGQGTIGLELLDEVPDLANVLVAVGGGGLASGIATAVHARQPSARVVGVAAAGAPGVGASYAANEVAPIPPRTIADGIALSAPSALTLSHLHHSLDELISVSDEDISRALLLMVERAKAAIEPAGAAPLAALFDPGISLSDGPTAVVIGGGNIDPLLLTKLIEHGLSVAGRYLVMSAVMQDQPGMLASLTDAVADLELNVLDVEHHRSGHRLQLGSVEVQLTVETRDHEHRGEVLAALESKGFDIELVD